MGVFQNVATSQEHVNFTLSFRGRPADEGGTTGWLEE
jgi:hypothetical protein